MLQLFNLESTWIVSESEIVLREAERSTDWKTWQPGRPGGIYRNRETPSRTGRVGKSVIAKDW